MPGIKRSGTWNKNPFGTIWHVEAFPSSDLCLMCVHQIPHSLEEHAMVLTKWPKPKDLTKKIRKPHVQAPPTAEHRQKSQRRQKEREEFRKLVWANT